MPHTPKKPRSPKKSQSKTSDQIPQNTSGRPQYLREQLNAIKEKFEECTSSYVAYCERKKAGPTDLNDNLREHKRQVKVFTDFLKNLQPPPDMQDSLPHIYERELRQIRKPAKKVRTVSGPDNMQPGCRRKVNSRKTNMMINDNKTRTKKIKQIIKEGEGVLHKLQTKGKDSQIKLNQKPNSSKPSLEVNIDANQLSFSCTAAEESKISIAPQNPEETGAESKTHTKSDIKLKLNKASLNGTVDENKLIDSCTSVGPLRRFAPTLSLEENYTRLDVKLNRRRNSLPLTVDDSCSFCTCPLLDKFSQNALTPNLEKSGAKPKSTKTITALKPTCNKTSYEIDVDNNELKFAHVGDQILPTPALNFECDASKFKSTKTKTDLKSNQNGTDSQVAVNSNKLACSSTVNTIPSNPTSNLEKNGAKPKYTKTKTNLEPNQYKPKSEVAGNNDKLAYPVTANTRPSTPASNLEKNGAKPKSTKTKTNLEPNQNKPNSEVVGNSNKLACPSTVNRIPSNPTSNLEKNDAKPKSTKTKTDLKSNQNKPNSEVAGNNDKLAYPVTANSKPSTPASNLEKNGDKPKSTKTKVDLKSNQNRANGEVAVDKNKSVCSTAGNTRISTPAPNMAKNGANPKSTKAKTDLKANQNRADNEITVNNKLARFSKVNTKPSTSTSNLAKNGATPKFTKTKMNLEPNQHTFSSEVVGNNKPVCSATGNARPSPSSNLQKNDAKAKSTKTKVDLKSNGNIADSEVAGNNNKLGCSLTVNTRPSNPTSEKNDPKAKSTKTKADLKPNKNKANCGVAVDTNKLACPSTGGSEPALTPDEVSVSIKVDQNQAMQAPIAVPALQKATAKHKSTPAKSDLNNGSTTVGADKNQPLLPKCDLSLKSPSELREIINGITEALHRSQTKQIRLDPKANPKFTIAVDKIQPFYRPSPHYGPLSMLAQMKASAKEQNLLIDVDEDKPSRPPTPFPPMVTTGVLPKATRTKLDSESSSEELNKSNFNHASLEVAVGKKYPIRPPTPGPNVQRTGVTPKATSVAELHSSKPRRVKTLKHLTEHERRKREELINTRNCSYCNWIHPRDPRYYHRERDVDVQTDALGVEIPRLEFPYLNQHLEDCKQEKRSNEIPVDKLDPDMNKSNFGRLRINPSIFISESFAGVGDGETASCGHSEAEADVLDDADEDVAVTAQNVGEQCNGDDLVKKLQQSEQTKIKMSGSENPEPAPATSTSPCKHTTGIPEWIDHCPFCDYDSPEHAGTVLPDFCKIQLNQTTCEITPPQLIKNMGRQNINNINAIIKQKISAQQKNNGIAKVGNKIKQNVVAETGNKRSSDAQVFANVLHSNLTHVGSGRNRYVKKSWPSQPPAAFYITEDEVEKKIKSLRKSHIHCEEWDEVFYGRVSQTFPHNSNGKNRKMYSMSSWIESQEYYKLCKPDF